MVCTRMDLENMVDSAELLQDKYQELIGRLCAQLPGCAVISRMEFYDHGLVDYRLSNYVLPGTCFWFEHGVYM
jgi:hypothetical protein